MPRGRLYFPHPRTIAKTQQPRSQSCPEGQIAADLKTLRIVYANGEIVNGGWMLQTHFNFVQ
jgi:hypothetical protein